jgi:hypothetical protein
VATEGGSAGSRARGLREQAAVARAKAERLDSMAASWEAGEIGEQRVAAALAPLEGEHCRVLHDRLLQPGKSRVNLDHLVICAAGNYLIDAKNWSGEVDVYQGSLRQRTSGGRRWLHTDRIDQVRRMADQMETASSAVIEPVICLAGEKASDFGAPVQLRGVFVVPVDRLADWLLNRPRPAASVDLRSQAVRLAAEFPSATEPAFLALPPLKRPARRAGATNSLSPETYFGSTTSGRRGDGRTRRTRQQRPRRDRFAFGKVIVLLCLPLLMMTPVGHRLLNAGAQAISTTIRRAAPPAPPGWPAPCIGVSDAAVTRAVGHEVYRYTNGQNDSCSWGFVARPNSYSLGPIRIVTGWTAKYGYSATKKPLYTHDASSQTLIVPQFTAVPKSEVPAGQVTQPLVVSIRWPGTPLSATQAQRAITTLAGELAKHLPTGADAGKVTPR